MTQLLTAFLKSARDEIMKTLKAELTEGTTSDIITTATDD
jgi:hypothetical protein